MLNQNNHQTDGMHAALALAPKQTRTSLISKNITVSQRRTSIRLEPEMWVAIKEIAKRERCTIHRICTIVNERKNEKSSLTAAIRVFIMAYYRAAATEEGHARAGHGYAVRHNLPMREAPKDKPENLRSRA